MVAELRDHPRLSGNLPVIILVFFGLRCFKVYLFFGLRCFKIRWKTIIKLQFRWFWSSGSVKHISSMYFPSDLICQHFYFNAFWYSLFIFVCKSWKYWKYRYVLEICFFFDIGLLWVTSMERWADGQLAK